MQRDYFSNNFSRRNFFKNTGLLGVVGFSGFTGIKMGSESVIAAPTGTPSINDGIRTGIHPVSPYDIEYQNLDTSSPITITYVFTDSSGTNFTDAHILSLSGKSISGTVNTGTHSVRVPPGEIKLAIKVSHPSLSSFILSSFSSEFTVLANASLSGDVSDILDSFSGENKAGENNVASYDINYEGLNTTDSLKTTYVFTDSDGFESADTYSIDLSGKNESDTVSTGSHDISVPSGTLDLDVEFSHSSLGENIVINVGSVGEVLATASVVDDGATVLNAFDGETLAGPVSIPSYEINYSGLDTGAQININYIFSDSGSSVSNETYSVSLSGKLESDTVSTGSHSISVPEGTLTLDIELSHVSLKSKEVTSVGSVGEIYPDVIDASGGTTVVDKRISGQDYRIHAFENVGNDTFSVNRAPSGSTFDVLLVGGGGGGGDEFSGPTTAGGGGGGGILFQQDEQVTSGSYTIDVGDGGRGGQFRPDNGERGEDTTALGFRAFGGGGGGTGQSRDDAPTYSTYGGGGGAPGNKSIDSTIAPATSQGNRGGDAGGQRGGSDGIRGGGGGGGCGKDGGSNGGDGGDGGDYSNHFGSSFGDSGIFAGGGGGGGETEDGNNGHGGDGGRGGGGDGSGRRNGNSGSFATGGGGGAGEGNQPGFNGGSGIVLIRYEV